MHKFILSGEITANVDNKFKIATISGINTILGVMCRYRDFMLSVSDVYASNYKVGLRVTYDGTDVNILIRPNSNWSGGEVIGVLFYI